MRVREIITSEKYAYIIYLHHQLFHCCSQHDSGMAYKVWSRPLLYCLGSFVSFSRVSQLDPNSPHSTGPAIWPSLMTSWQSASASSSWCKIIRGKKLGKAYTAPVLILLKSTCTWWHTLVLNKWPLNHWIYFMYPCHLLHLGRHPPTDALFRSQHFKP